MKKGICVGNISAEGTFEEKLRATRAAGYDGVELTFSAPGKGPLHLESTEAEVRALSANVAQLGLQTPSLMCGHALRDASLISADAATRARGVANLRLALERARWLGAGDILVHPGQLQENAPYDQAFDWLVDALRQLRPAADAAGVGLAVENVWNKFLLSPREMRELVDAVGNPLIGCYLDVANMLLYGYATQWVRIVGRRIRKVHLKDFKRSVGTGQGFCQLLDGDANYPTVMAALREIGYDDYLTSEVDGDMVETSRRIDRILAM